MKMDLKRATTKDVDAFLDIERSVDGTPTYSAMTYRNEALAEIEKNFVYLIRESDQIVGSIMYEMKSPKHAYISGLAIYPEFQNQGIGKAATIKILEELKDIPTIDLVTHPDNERAIKLYKSIAYIHMNTLWS